MLLLLLLLLLLYYYDDNDYSTAIELHQVPKTIVRLVFGDLIPELNMDPLG